jgi:NitT/TauT family transport system ATP-binding protein
VIIFSNRPARIVAEIRINLPRPRSQEARYTAGFDSLTKEIFGLINKNVNHSGAWSYEI